MVGKKTGHYKILEKLGQGGMGEVYLAEDIKLDRKVAIKFLPQNLSQNNEQRKRFQIEARAAAALNHPNIAHIYAIEEADDQIFIVMEYVEGQEIKDLVEAHRDTPISVGQCIDIVTQIAEGLQAAHDKGIIHRDIKSSNIMITNKSQVKIMDFGLAKVEQGIQLTKEQSTLGTAAYMSPEQSRGEALNHRTDIWALGVVFYEMLTGQLPFQGDYEQAIIYSILNEEPKNIQILRPDCPSNLQQFISKMLVKDQEKRFQSMAEILHQLGNIQQSTKQKSEDGKDEYPSIAVLPFNDMSPAKDQRYFCEGISEEILNSLNKIEGLQVSSRTSSFQFRDKNLDIREIGQKLNVKTILEGSVRKFEERLRINVQLVKVEDGFHLWSDRYDRKLEDVFTVQDDIAENVVTALKGILTPGEREKIHSQETVIEAYEYFLKGRQLLNQFAMHDSKEMFEMAIKQAPDYAPAYAGLSDVHSWLFEWWGANPDNLKAADRYSLKALEIAPHLAESHISRGYVLALDKKYSEAEKEFEEAIRLDPNAFDAYYYYARSCFARGEIEKSAELFAKAAEVRREDFQSMSLLSQSLSVLGREEEAAAANRECIRRSERQLHLDPTNRRAISLGALALFSDGQEKQAFELLERGLNLYPEDNGILINGACLMARARRKEDALDLLEKVFGKGYGKKDWIEHDPDYDILRDDPRFQALLEGLH